MSFHADTVGSYLRSPHLLEARKEREKGKITPEQLTQIENDAIKELVEKQVAAGLKIVTDGELRRDNYIVDFTCGLKGVVAVNASDPKLKPQLNPKMMEERGSYDIYFTILPHVEGKISSNPEHPEYTAFKHLKSVTPAGIIPKVIIPSPLFLTIMRPDDNPFPKPAYTNEEDFHKDISKAYHETILHFYELGARV
jgi:methionine synthase II (cobalamin-independent)